MNCDIEIARSTRLTIDHNVRCSQVMNREIVNRDMSKHQERLTTGPHKIIRDYRTGYKRKQRLATAMKDTR